MNTQFESLGKAKQVTLTKWPVFMYTQKYEVYNVHCMVTPANAIYFGICCF